MKKSKAHHQEENLEKAAEDVALRSGKQNEG